MCSLQLVLHTVHFLVNRIRLVVEMLLHKAKLAMDVKVGSDVGQGGSDVEYQPCNRFELMKPMPSKIFSKKANAKSRATTSRLLTGEKHLSSLQEELRLSAEKASKINKRKRATENEKCKPVLKKIKADKPVLKKIKPDKVMTKKMKKLTCREEKQEVGNVKH